MDETGRNGRTRTGARSVPHAAADAVAARCVTNAVRAGATHYDRDRHLPALLRRLPGPWSDAPEAAADIVARLGRALQVERKRARTGHWCYDLNRHIALRQALDAETSRLAELQPGRRASRPALRPGNRSSRGTR